MHFDLFYMHQKLVSSCHGSVTGEISKIGILIFGYLTSYLQDICLNSKQWRP